MAGGGGELQRIVIHGLHNAFLSAATIVDPRLVAIGNVRIRDAPALLALLDKEVGRHGWVIERRHRLASLARLEHEFTVVLDAIVPILIHSPLHNVAGLELMRYGLSVQHLAASIFGRGHALYTAVRHVGRFIRRHAQHQFKGTRGAAWLTGNILEVRNRVSALESDSVQFPEDGAELPKDDVGSDVGGGGGGELQRIVIHGLRDAFISAATIVGPRLVAIGDVRVRDAPALLALLDREVARHGWVIEHRRLLARIARLEHEFTVILETIVPILIQSPFDSVAGRELRRYGWSVQHLAASTFGRGHALYTAVRPVGCFLRRHAVHQHKGTRGAAWFAHNILEVRCQIWALKFLSVPFLEKDEDQN